MWRLAVIAAIAGCGRLRFDPMGATGDGQTPGGDGTTSGDGVMPVTCTSFGAPVAVGGVNSALDEWAPALSPDGKTLVFSRVMAGLESLYIATLVSGTMFGGTMASVALAGSNTSGSATWFPDGSGIYFSSDRAVLFSYRLYASAFDGTSFSAPVEVPELVNELVIAPALSRSGLELFYSDQQNQTSIRRATRATLTSPWVVQGYVAELNVLGDGYAGLSPDGLTIYFESQRDNAMGYIYEATRPAIGAPFGPVTAVATVNDGMSSGDPEVSADGRALFYTALRTGGVGLGDLYVTTCQ